MALGQAFSPDLLKDVPAELDKDFISGVSSFGRGGSRSSADTYQVKPEYAKYAIKNPVMGKSGLGGQGQTKYYEIPTGKTYQDKPLVARYDTQGNFQFVTFPEDQYLRIDPSNPAVISQPKINKSGEIIDYGINVQGDFGGSGLGGFVSDIASDFGPMILAGLGANYFTGSGLLGGAPAATGGAAAGATAAAPVITGGTAAGLGASTGTGLTLGGGGLGLSTGGAGLGITAGSAGAGTIGAGLGSTLAGITTGIGAGTVAGSLGGATTGGVAGAGTGTIGGGMTPVDYSLGTAGTGTVGGTGVTSSVLSAISSATGISVDTLKTFAPSVIQGLLGATGSYLTSEQGKDAATINAKAITDAATIAADAARFRPVGVTTRFGSSNFTTDAAGNVITAGYTPSAEITGYQDRLRTLAGQGMTDIEGARTAYQPLTGAAQNLFSLGKSYLAKTPEQAAQDYITKQTALLTPSRETQLANIRNNLFQTGRTGSATSQGGSLMNTNPELAAYYNAVLTGDLTLAAQADQEARNRITFGSGLFDTGANLQGRYYTGQTAAYSPFTTAIDTSSGLERLAQQPLDLSTSIGQKVSTANANVGQLTGQGIINAANVMAPANAYSLGGNVLTGAANSPVLNNAINRAFGNTPTSTQQMFTFNPATGQFVPVQQQFVP